MDELTGLTTLAAQRRELDQRELDLIDRARHAGATWGEIAAALGLASRQAAEQRRQRLRSALRSRRQEQDQAYAQSIAPLRAAVLDLLRHLDADRSWAGRFPRAALVRSTLAAAADAAPGALFTLTEQALADLRSARAPGVPRPLRAATAALRAALKSATPSTKH